MAFDPMPASGSGGNEPWCSACNAPITKEQRSVHIRFDNDPHGHKGLTGPYHERCSKPFASLAHVVNLNWFGRL
ncbi:hypothetical protein [Flaviflagellibacter deserti]|uniref:Uncharacterized protein n=1 Tax=Flaviflagellibacter deserti TaxID=2267266 RepID=A0ABV9YXH2_9HYPH